MQYSFNNWSLPKALFVLNIFIAKCNIFLYLMSRIKVFLSFQNRKRFYNAYVLPLLICVVLFGEIVLQSWKTNL